MSETNFKVSACFNLITKNFRFLEVFNHHPDCSKCQVCFEITECLKTCPGEDCSEILKSFFNRKDLQGINMKSVFASHFVAKSKCECGSKFLQPLSNILQVSVPKLLKYTNFSELVHRGENVNNHCCNSSCKVKKATRSILVKGDCNNVVFSVSWENKDLKTLIYFILGLKDQMDAGQLLGRPEDLYLEGMIVSNDSTSVYTQMNPCTIYSSMQKKTEIYMDYLLFALIQHSLFPSVLVFSSTPRPSDFSEKSVVYEEKLWQFLDFFTGDMVLQQGICFYCWYTDHSTCDSFNGKNFWTCSGGHLNPILNLFCNTCENPRQPLPQAKVCMFCGSKMNSNYCQKCSMFKNCFQCNKNILRSQSFACNECNVWVNSLKCSKCQKEPARVKCFACFSGTVNQICSHGSARDCLLCLYDYTCGVCYEPKKVFEEKFCWSCKNKLLEGFCIICKYYPAKNSFVCSDCVKSNKRCGHGHIITKQSAAYCRFPAVQVGNCDFLTKNFCSKCPKPNHNCSDQVFCCECGSRVSKLQSSCILCEVQAADHVCKENNVCQLCAGSLEVCDCGCKLVTSSKKCRKCSKMRIPNEKIPQIFHDIFAQGLELGKPCSFCGFPNKDFIPFCENCNQSIKSLYSDKTQCKVCKKFTTGNYCESCYRCSSCSTCKKDLLIGQRQFCRMCNSEIYNRVCNKCKILVPLSSLQCLTCVESNWSCPLNHNNSSSDPHCLICNIPKFPICHICKNPEVSTVSSWRSTSRALKPIQNDCYCCLTCRQKQPKCVCGSRVLAEENICLVCSNSLVNL